MRIRQMVQTDNQIKLTVSLWQTDDGAEAVLYAIGYPSGNVQTRIYKKSGDGEGFKKQETESLFMGRFFIKMVSSVSEAGRTLYGDNESPPINVHSDSRWSELRKMARQLVA